MLLHDMDAGERYVVEEGHDIFHEGCLDML
jgi:hypothetical protein